MADVFVSYKRKDRELAAVVVAQLDFAGYNVWWDQHLTPREAWDDLIERELNAAKAVLVLWTPRSVTSEWVKNEADYAKSLNKLVPTKLEACKVPLAFRRLQTADLTSWSGAPGHAEWQKTLKWIGDLVGEPSKQPTQKPQEHQAQKDEIVALHGYLARLRDELAEATRERDHAMASHSVSVAGRVHAELLRLARLGDGRSIRPAPAVSVLAVRVHSTREVVSRTINLLERRGIIRRDSDALFIISPQRLEEMIA